MSSWNGEPSGLSRYSSNSTPTLAVKPSEARRAEHLLEHRARIQQRRTAVVRNDVGDDVADPGPPRQRSIRRKVGNGIHVGIAAAPVRQPQRVDRPCPRCPSPTTLRRRRIRCQERDSGTATPGSVCPVRGRTDHSRRSRSRPTIRRRVRCATPVPGSDGTCTSVDVGIDRVRHGCVTVLSPTRLPTTTPAMNETTSSPTMAQPRMVEPPTRSSGWRRSAPVRPPARPVRARARPAPATASTRDGHGRSTPTRPPMWRSAVRRSRPWWRRRTRCRTARPDRA